MAQAVRVAQVVLAGLVLLDKSLFLSKILILFLSMLLFRRVALYLQMAVMALALALLLRHQDHLIFQVQHPLRVAVKDGQVTLAAPVRLGVEVAAVSEEEAAAVELA